MYSFEEEQQIQKAITLLVENFNKTGTNSKPVILHSIRVAMKLYDDHYEEKIIIAALLHDLIEDTEVTFKEIVDGFGEEAGHLVSACSFDSSIMDPTERYKEANLRCKVSGKNALIIKSADFLDNLPYTLGRRGDNYEFLKAKTKHVIDQAAAVIADESIFKALLVSYKNLTTADNS